MIGEDFKAFFRQMASGVCVVTVWAEGRLRGFTATSVTSVSMAPPVALFCVSKRNESYAYIRAKASIGISILSEDQRHLSDRFAAKAGLEGYSFIQTTLMTSGVPVLGSALGQVTGLVREIICIGDHAVVLIEIQEARATAGKMPILYFDQSYRYLAKQGRACHKRSLVRFPTVSRS